MEVIKLMAEIGALISSLATLSVLGVFYYQHKLMWSDFRKKHDLNGNAPEGDQWNQ